MEEDEMSKELDVRIAKMRGEVNAWRRALYWLVRLKERSPTLDPELRLKVTRNFHLIARREDHEIRDEVVYVVIPCDLPSEGFEEIDVVFEAPQLVAYEIKGWVPGRRWILGGGYGPSPEEAIAGYLREPGKWG